MQHPWRGGEPAAPRQSCDRADHPGEGPRDPRQLCPHEHARVRALLHRRFLFSRVAIFRSIFNLQAAINRSIAAPDRDPRPFVRAADRGRILASATAETIY